MDIYAELTRKQLRTVEGGDMEFCLPYGITMSRRSGSRACYFQCSDIPSLIDLVEGLEASWITWQDNLEDSEYLDLVRSEHYGNEVVQEIIRGSGRHLHYQRIRDDEQEEARIQSRYAF